MDPEKTVYISFDDIISELHTNVLRCGRDCQTCHKYILKLTRHLNSVHIEPSAQEIGERDTDEVSPRRSSRNLQSRKHVNYSDRITHNARNSELSGDHLSNIIYIDATDIKCESDELDFDLNVFDDPLRSDLSPGADYSSENTSTKNDQMSGDTQADISDSDGTRTRGSNSRKRKNCTAKVKNIPEQNKPKRKRTGKEGITCKICGVTFTRKSKFLAHERNAHKLGKKHICILCKEECPSERDLHNHLKLTHGAKPYHCDREHCGRSFNIRRSYNHHVKTVHAEVKNFVCELCGQSFSTKTSMDRHVRSIHTENRNHLCKTCGKSFSRKYRLISHERTHTNEKPTHVCQICKKGYYSEDRLTIHSTVHTENESYPCKECGINFKLMIHLQRHRQTHKHNTGKPTHGKKFPCKTCGQKYPTKFQLTIHERTHTGEKPFTCHLCGKGLISNERLKIHLKSAHEEKGFVCTVCDKGFTFKIQLTQHIRLHTGEKPFKCDQCDLCYYRRDKLMIHKRTHTGE